MLQSPVCAFPRAADHHESHQGCLPLAGVACVWASVLFASFSYYSALPEAGSFLAPTALWITVAGLLIADTWRVNNTEGQEPLWPYKGDVKTNFWFTATDSA